MTKLSVNDYAMMSIACKARKILYNDLSEEKKCAMKLRVIFMRKREAELEKQYQDSLNDLRHTMFQDLEDIILEEE